MSDVVKASYQSIEGIKQKLSSKKKSNCCDVEVEEEDVERWEWAFVKEGEGELNMTSTAGHALPALWVGDEPIITSTERTTSAMLGKRVT